MSQTFTLTPAPEHEVLTVRQALDLSSLPLAVFRIPEEHLEEVLGSPASRLILLLGDPERSGRGFEFTFEDDRYDVREFTPSTPTDWQIALAFMSDLAKALDVDIVGEDDTRYTAESIRDYPYLRDVESGIRMLSMVTAEGSDLVMPGIRRDVAFTADMAAAITASDEPTATFEQVYTGIQNIPAFDASQMVMKDSNDKIFGAYVLSEGVDTILPKQPSLDDGYEDLTANDIDRWELYLGIDAPDGYEPLGCIPYEQMLQRIPEAKLHHIDGKSVLVDALTQEEIIAVYGQ